MPNWNNLNDRGRRAAVLEEIVGKRPDQKTRSALQTAEAVEEAARFLRQMREDAGLSQEQLGKMLGVSQARISELERGGTPDGMSYSILRRAAIACGLQDWPPAPSNEMAFIGKGQVRDFELQEVGLPDEHEIVARILKKIGDEYIVHLETKAGVGLKLKAEKLADLVRFVQSASVPGGGVERFVKAGRGTERTTKSK